MPRRRTQQERSSETRAALIEAAIACLSEVGYHRMTSKMIAERAGLSRGAQLHHFGSKAQLVTAAMEHLYRMYHQAFVAELATIDAEVHPAEASIDILWRIMTGPAGLAYLALASAARTEPELKEPMAQLVARMNQGHDELFAELFGAAAGSERVFSLITTGVFALMEGLVIESIVREGDDLERIHAVLAQLRRLAPLAVTPR